MVDWNRVRRDFPVTGNLVYFQSAAMSPLPRPVFAEVVRGYERLLNFGDIDWGKNLQAREALYRRLGKLLGSESGNLTFVPSTSAAVSLVAQSFQNLAPRPFHVISLEDEFPASTVGFEYLKIPMRYVGSVAGRYPVERILAQVDSETLAVVVSLVQYATGFRLDVRRLGAELRRRGVLFMVNATQGFPFYPIDVETDGIDVLIASLHKWGFAGHVGALFFTSADFRKRFPSPWAGWMGIDTSGKGPHAAKNEPFRLYPSAAQYELGTANMIPFLALNAALDYLEGIGLAAIRERIGELSAHLVSRLREIGVSIVSPVEHKDERSPIVSFTLAERSAEAVEALESRKISVSLRRGLIRVSLNIFNDHSDIDALIGALREFLGG